MLFLDLFSFVICKFLGEWICPCKYCQFFDARKQFYLAYRERVSVWQMQYRDQFVTHDDVTAMYECGKVEFIV